MPALPMNEIATQLNLLYSSNNDNAARSSANQWLQQFQKTPDAWSVAGALLSESKGAPVEPKLFAAQTFRSKIIYDLQDLQTQDKVALRDSLLAALKFHAPEGQRVLIRQICLSLADLLLQLPEWKDAVQGMVADFGQSPELASSLLEFLTVLPEEASTNGRIDPTNNEILTTANAEQVIALLAMYIQAPGITPALRKQTLICLSAWLRAGGVNAEVVGRTPLFDAAFEALNGYELFDEAVGIICDLIHETQEIQDNVNVIQQIVPRLIALTPLIQQARDDTDRIRGFTKILCEAGEWYVPLMLQHQATFVPIVQAIAECAACNDLEVVQVTFSFWYRLSKGLQKSRDDPANQPFLQTFAQLVDTIINQLAYPPNDEAQTAQEVDEFREFRHNIGDNLKDCCAVLGVNVCLQRAFDAISTETAKGPGLAQWQKIEAPLFAMRSMGAKVDPKDNEILPKIMDALPGLPAHPKIRYAAILVISRYTEWTNEHPEHLPFQLEYVSSGFGDADTKVWLASAMAIQYLCQDCGRHLVSYLPQLHNFMQEIGSRLPADDLLAVSDGIAHILVRMDQAAGLTALQEFCKPILEQILRLSSSAQHADKETLNLIMSEFRFTLQVKTDLLSDDRAAALEQLDVFLKVCLPLCENLPTTCQKTSADAWSILQSLLRRYGARRGIAENASSVMRRSIDFFGHLLMPLMPDILATLSDMFKSTGMSGYVWITGSLAVYAAQEPVLSNNEPGLIRQAIHSAFDIESETVFGVLQTGIPADHEDVIEDYLGLVSALFRRLPDMLLASTHLKSAIMVVAVAFKLYSEKVVRMAIDLLLDLLGHDSMAPSPPPDLINGEAYRIAIRNALLANGQVLVSGLINGLVLDLDDTAGCITAFRLFAERFPAELPGWVAEAVSKLPSNALSSMDIQKFITAFQMAMSTGNLAGVREAFTNLDRASRKSKARAWDSEREAKRMGI